MWYNNTKLQQYLDTLNSFDKNIVNQIINKSLFFTTNEITNMVKNSFETFISQFPKYNLLIPDSKIGSEHYFLMQLENELLNNKPETIIYDNLFLINNDYPIVIIDDVIYSSNNMCSHIDNLQYNYKKVFKTKLTNDFICIVSILSSKNIQVIQEFNAKVFYNYVANELLPEKIIQNYDFKYMYKHFGCETNLILPIVVEHKIANNFGSYQFFHNILSNPINRKDIDKITKSNIKMFIKKLKK